MSDLIEDGWGDDPGDAGGPGSNAPEYSVSEVSGAVKRTLEGAFGRIRVKGEVGRVFAARSGHLYFDIKDDRAVLASVVWKGQIGALTVRPEEGMEVVCTGRLTTFPSQSKYQLTVDQVEPAGVGALMAMLEKRKAKLEAEGLFAAERKRALPYLPRVIGVVTSPGGAVIRDILHRLADRFPRHVLVWPVAVQGKACAPQVAAAIEGFNRLVPGGAIPRPDVLIVARGGGSIEDLWGFNEEIVARAAAASAIPLISAVGHETDTTLIDYVSDRRAPTPTAAAEMAVPVRRDLIAEIGAKRARLTSAQARSMSRRAERLSDLGRALPRPEALTAAARQRLDYAAERLPLALTATLQRRRLRLAQVAAAIRPAALTGPVREGQRRVEALGAGLARATLARLRLGRRDLDRVSATLTPSLVARGQARRADALGGLTRRLGIAARTDLHRERERLAGLDRLLSGLGYRETLRRGFAVVRADKRVVTTQVEAAASTGLEIEFQDGRLHIDRSGTIGAAKPAKPAKPARRRKPPPEQGQLF